MSNPFPNSKWKFLYSLCNIFQHKLAFYILRDVATFNTIKWDLPMQKDPVFSLSVLSLDLEKQDQSLFTRIKEEILGPLEQELVDCVFSDSFFVTDILPEGPEGPEGSCLELEDWLSEDELCPKVK